MWLKLIGTCAIKTILKESLWFVYYRAIRDPVGKIRFAGTETAWEWSGYVSGAIMAGERAAKEILLEEGAITKEELRKPEPEIDIGEVLAAKRR